MNYYNDNDPKICRWLEKLIERNLIAPGKVDCRSISEIKPDELQQYTQCHFFAGIGGWPYALRLIGWPDEMPVWTGSCPCQPFSIAGDGNGTADERHLWPDFKWLIEQRRPAICFGEQVASKLGREWLSGVRVDLETMGYEVGAADLCAASVGAPHIRQRLYWVANSTGNRGCCGGTVEKWGFKEFGGPSSNVRLGNANLAGLQGWKLQSGECSSEQTAWAGGVALRCRDGKSRRVEPESFKVVDGVPHLLDALRAVGASESEIQTALQSFPLAQGFPGRVGLLRGYGNAIIPQLAAQFIMAFVEATKLPPETKQP